MRYQNLKSTLRSVVVLAAMVGSVSAVAVSPATADELAAKLIDNSKPGLNIISVSFLGDITIQGGLFSDGPSGLSQGVILSNGKASDAVKVPGQSAPSTILGFPGSPLCSTIGGQGPNFDAAVLTVNVDVNRTLYDALNFTYVVGSNDATFDIVGVLVNGRIAASGVGVLGQYTDLKSTRFPQESAQQSASAALLPSETTVTIDIAVCDRGDNFKDTALFLGPIQPFKGSVSPTTAVQTSPGLASPGITTAKASMAVTTSSRSTTALTPIASSISGLVVSPATANELAARLIDVSKPGLSIISASFFGNVAIQGGLFSDGPSGLSQGVILSNGMASDAVKAPFQSAPSSQLGLPGSPLCLAISGGQGSTFDAAVLTVNLNVDRTIYDALDFTYVVGSNDATFDIVGVLVNGRIAASGVGVLGQYTDLKTTRFPQESAQQSANAVLLPGETTVTLEIAVCDRGDGIKDTALFLAPLRPFKRSISTTAAIQTSSDQASRGSSSARANIPATTSSRLTSNQITGASRTAIWTNSTLAMTSRSTVPTVTAAFPPASTIISDAPSTGHSDTTALQTGAVQSSQISIAIIEATAAQSTTTEIASVTPTLPPATAVTSYALSVSNMPLICPGTVITLAPSATAASLIEIDSNGVLSCDGKQAYLRAQPFPSQLFEVVLYTPPPPTGMNILASYFSLATGSMVAQFTPFMRQQRRQIGMLPVGLGQSNTLVVGVGVSPVTGSPLIVPSGSGGTPSAALSVPSPSSASTALSSPAALLSPSFSSGATGGTGPVSPTGGIGPVSSTGVISTVSPSGGSGPVISTRGIGLVSSTGGIGPVSSTGVISTVSPSGGIGSVNSTPVTVTSTATLTVPGTTQTVVVLQVFINGSPVLPPGSGAGGPVTTAGQINVYVTIAGVVLNVSAAGLLPISPTVISGSPALGGFAPVMVNVVVLVAPVVLQVGSSVVTSFSTMQAYVTAVAGGAGLTQGSGAVTLVNLAPVATITATQTIVVPSVNAAGITTVPVAPVSGVVAVVLSPGVVPSAITAAIAANAAVNAAPPNGLPSSRSAADKVVPALLAAVVAVLFASYVV